MISMGYKVFREICFFVFILFSYILIILERVVFFIYIKNLGFCIK